MKKKTVVVIGICGGIAGYKAVKLIELLRAKDYEVKVVMTKTAQRMFPKVMFEKALSHKVYSSLVAPNFKFQKILKEREVEHVKIADSANLIVIIPATANILGKIASGIADDLLSTIIMASKAPILFCPSMNIQMWRNPILQENIRKLKKAGHHFIDPTQGNLACGYRGVGRLAELKTIDSKIYQIIKKQNRLKGLKVLVTAGGTSEPIDQVRIITNRSSGKMGVAIARACLLQGARVKLLRAQSSYVAQHEVEEEKFTTARDLEYKIKKNIHYYDVVFHSAAVSDFKAVRSYSGKLDSSQGLNLILKPTVKIIDRIKKWKPEIILVGFKAVYNKTESEMIAIGKQKMQECNADYICINDVGKPGIGFTSDHNKVILISQKGLLRRIKKARKEIVAEEILNTVFSAYYDV